MIEVSSMDRQELCKTVKPMLPVYVIGSGEVFEAYDISYNLFRDKPGIEMYSLKTKERQPAYPKCNKLRIQAGQIIVKTLDEAEEYYKIKKAEKIKKEFSSIEEKYLDYKKFIKENSEYFLVC
jgi:hypothetical protein